MASQPKNSGHPPLTPAGEPPTAERAAAEGWVDAQSSMLAPDRTLPDAVKLFAPPEAAAATRQEPVEASNGVPPPAGAAVEGGGNRRSAEPTDPDGQPPLAAPSAEPVAPPASADPPTDPRIETDRRDEPTDPSIKPPPAELPTPAPAQTGSSEVPTDPSLRADVVEPLADLDDWEPVELRQPPSGPSGASTTMASTPVEGAPPIPRDTLHTPLAALRAAAAAEAEPQDEDGLRHDTVVLDKEMQDRLMALRARQDQMLKSRLGAQVVVMFSDLVGSTAYYEQHGDLRGRQKMLVHNALLFPIIRSHNGTIVKTIGDAIMACFATPAAGLEAAREMQLALRDHNATCADRDDEIHIRLGLNAGPAIAEDGDLHGDAVNVAARVQATAEGDDILITESLVTDPGDPGFESIGLIPFKGKAEPVKIFRLKWGGDDRPLAAAKPRVVATRYRITRELGRGPLGVVWAAEDLRLRVPVVLKLLHRFLCEDDAADNRLTDWMRTQAALHHDGIVRLIDCSHPGADEPFLVGDRIDGTDLAVWVTRNGCPEPRRATRMVRDLAEPLAYAHRHAVVHGDLKPENVLIDQHNHVRLSDFGAAELASRASVDSPVASVGFFAPEQVTGGRLDARTDVYGLGALLYFLLTGKTPHKTGASLNAARAVASGLYTPLERCRPDLPQALCALCAQAMSSKPESRFETVEAFALALEPFCRSDSITLEDVAAGGGANGEPPAARPEPMARNELTWDGGSTAPAASPPEPPQPSASKPTDPSQPPIGHRVTQPFAVPVHLLEMRIRTLRWSLFALAAVAAGALITLAVVLVG